MKDVNYLIKFIIIIIGIIWVFGIGALLYICEVKIEFYPLGMLKQEKTNIQSEEDYMDNVSHASTFLSYEGNQTGSQVKALVNRLIANANTYRDQPEMVPIVSYNSAENESDLNYDLDKTSCEMNEDTNFDTYTSYLNQLSKNLSLKHNYYVNMEIDNNGKEITAGVTINFDIENTKSNFVLKDEKHNDNTLSSIHSIECIDGIQIINNDFFNEV